MESKSDAHIVFPDASDPEASFRRCAARLHVVGFWQATSHVTHSLTDKPGPGPFRAWGLRHEGEEESHTTVVHGPTAIIIYGNVTSFVFERPSGGLGLGFWDGGLEYAAEKATAGEVHGYATIVARREFATALDRRVAEQDMKVADAEAVRGDMEQLDWDDYVAVERFYRTRIAASWESEYRPLGQIYTSPFLWAIACVKAVHDYEASKTADHSSG